MQEIVDRSLWLRRAYSGLFGGFAGFRLVLSRAGVYGVISYTVTQRTQIGFGMALGAEPRQVLAQELREGMLLVGAGVAILFSVAIFATRFLESMLASVSTRDPWALAIAIVLLSAAALAANAVPARRAAVVNLVDALRFQLSGHYVNPAVTQCRVGRFRRPDALCPQRRLRRARKATYLCV
jgi:ABC-type antimicrobial peptide transport system permease subunit